jgi:hypothetical protein
MAMSAGSARYGQLVESNLNISKAVVSYVEFNSDVKLYRCVFAKSRVFEVRVDGCNWR